MVKKILLADDSPVIQTLSKKIFQGQGYEIKGIKTGTKVLEEIEKNDYDVVILDIILPGADGMELAREIRGFKDKKKADIPIIAISGNYKNYSKSDFDEVGINEYLIKPLDYDALVNAVKKHTQ
ncbi:Putative histidine kinase acting on RcsB [Fulvivirga imtechensis AK7]|uniref:Putative histidine kinase acting on RcsB n=1 Tax=Fulvivirga imtechensis AK7 TaxID=1237149 RepID=L8JTM1_9BACT|nr:response regulator [Fulvivirga imtechensis]ELR72331.1 Putative histidine kinase acting on RcsB [Fulvivirga imtechensis AK7]